jgi:sugar lactone lactonase YvrE
VPTQTALNRPGGLALDNDGLLYIADSYNHRIRVFDPRGAK